MSFSQPSSPDPTTSANAQTLFNTEAAQTQNRTNSYNQSNPFGSLTYSPDGNSPSGYSINTTLAPAQQALLDQQNQSKVALGATGGTLAGTAGDLAASTAGMYGSAPNIDGSAVTKQLNNWDQQYLQPIFNQQQSNTDAQLHNQGLAPGSEAYNNAENLLARNQGDITNQYLQQNQQQGFNQAVTNYQLPQQMIAQLLGNASGAISAAGPQAGMFQQGPTATIQPANYQQAAQNNFTNQQAQFQNTIAGVGKIAGAVAGF